MLVDTQHETCSFAPAFGQDKETKTREIPEHFLEESISMNEEIRCVYVLEELEITCNFPRAPDGFSSKMQLNK